MWWYILPSYMIIAITIAIPTYAIAGLNIIAYGTLYQKSQETPWDRRFLLRDFRVSKVPRKQNGLEIIDDEGDDCNEIEAENEEIAKNQTELEEQPDDISEKIREADTPKISNSPYFEYHTAIFRNLFGKRSFDNERIEIPIKNTRALNVIEEGIENLMN